MMVKTGQNRGKQRQAAHAIRSIHYFNPNFPSLGIEAFTLAEVRRRDREGHLKSLQRPGFHVLIHVIDGIGAHYVDFERYECNPGTLLLIQPGQVQRFSDDDDLQADIIIFIPEFLSFDSHGVGRSDLRSDPIDPTWSTVAPSLKIDAQERMLSNWDTLKREYRATDGSTLSASILRHLLRALLLQIAQGSATAPLRSTQLDSLNTFRRFSLELEKRFPHTRSVEVYAKKLGCSPKTLGRACLAARGVSAKETIERRVLLEAKRLLAHSDLSVAAIATHIGYSDAANFVKFFRHRTGMTPLEFRGRALRDWE